jgi:hypothetical protein
MIGRHRKDGDGPPPGVSTRLVSVADAAAMADLLRANRDFLAPWEPVRPDDYFTTSAPTSRTCCGTTTRGRRCRT